MVYDNYVSGLLFWHYDYPFGRVLDRSFNEEVSRLMKIMVPHITFLQGLQYFFNATPLGWFTKGLRWIGGLEILAYLILLIALVQGIFIYWRFYSWK